MPDTCVVPEGREKQSVQPEAVSAGLQQDVPVALGSLRKHGAKEVLHREAEQNIEKAKVQPC